MIIPKQVQFVLQNLQKAGFEAYIVGGCVRDFLMQKNQAASAKSSGAPRDWDITTSAKPEEIQKIFPESFYENKFLTVTVKVEDVQIEVTTYRKEANYSDNRHPDEVRFAKTLEEDVSRRDFTVNAMAIEIPNSKSQITKVVDLFDGQEDLQNKIIRTVGKAEERFSEDALRILRAVRFATTLDFTIEEKTAQAIKKQNALIKNISQERIRDEFIKIIMSPRAHEGIEMLRGFGLLEYILPELLENYGVTQNKHHIYDCYQHALKALEYSATKNFSLEVRLASLFHDIGKPRSKSGNGDSATFYNHEMIGAKMVYGILKRLCFSNKEIQKIVALVRYHMFYYNVDEVTESSVRRLIRNIGPENVDELLQLREADRIGSGVPKAEPYKLRHLKYIIDKVSQDPISVGMLKVNGKDVMDALKIQPGPRIGQMLDILLGIVLDDPKKNTKELLLEELKNLNALPESQLQALAEKSKEDKFEVQAQEDKKIKNKYWVK